MTSFRNRRRLRSIAAAIAVAGMTTAVGAQAAGPDLLSRALCKEAVPYVAQSLPGVLEPVRRDGHCMAGDFNGDGKPDIIMVVKVQVARVPAATGVKTLYPFYDHEAGKNRLQFLALHSTPASGKADWAHYDRLLLDGSSPILVLGHPDMASDMERVSQRSRVVGELQVPRRAMRGEAVLLGTEAVEAVLYWNGSTYVFHEDPAGP